jgi:hypothetical protein
MASHPTTKIPIRIEPPRRQERQDHTERVGIYRADAEKLGGEESFRTDAEIMQREASREDSIEPQRHRGHKGIQRHDKGMADDG